MSKSYFPADRAGRIDWYSNFAKEFPKAGKDLGFSETEITNAVNDTSTAGRTTGTEPGRPRSCRHAVLSGSSGDYVDLPRARARRLRCGLTDTRRRRGTNQPRRNSAPTSAANSKLENSRPRIKSSSVARARPKILSRSCSVKPVAALGQSFRRGKGDKSPAKVGFFFRTPAIDTAPGKGELNTARRDEWQRNHSQATLRV